VAGRDNVTTLAVEPGDPSALAQAISRLLADSELRARLGAAARQRVLEKFTWRAAAAATADRYRAVIGAAHDPIRWDDHRNSGTPRALHVPKRSAGGLLTGTSARPAPGRLAVPSRPTVPSDRAEPSGRTEPDRGLTC
jgi:hypothetical protein